MSNSFLNARDDLNLPKSYHSPQIDVEFKLNTNESPFELPKTFTDELKKELENLTLNRYPDRNSRTLKKLIAKKNSLSEEEVFVANGSNELIQTIFLAYGGPLRKVLIFEPTYAMHSQIAKVTGTKVILGTRNPSFEIIEKDALKLIETEKPEIVFLCSPNNPTGGVEDPKFIETILNSLKKYGGLLVVDEAYEGFSESSAFKLFSQDSPLVIIRTFSKLWALAGLRIGYLFAPNYFINEFEKVCLPYHLDSFKQRAAEIALKHEDRMSKNARSLTNERERVFETLRELPLDIWPSKANFLLFKPQKIDGKDLWKSLLDRSILIRDCSDWEGLDGCLRVTIGMPSENNVFLNAMREELL